MQGGVRRSRTSSRRRCSRRVVGPVFNHIANTFIDAFVRRADAASRARSERRRDVAYAAPGARRSCWSTCPQGATRRRCGRRHRASSRASALVAAALRTRSTASAPSATRPCAAGDRVEITAPAGRRSRSDAPGTRARDGPLREADVAATVRLRRRGGIRTLSLTALPVGADSATMRAHAPRPAYAPGLAVALARVRLVHASLRGRRAQSLVDRPRRRRRRRTRSGTARRISPSTRSA